MESPQSTKLSGSESVFEWKVDAGRGGGKEVDAGRQMLMNGKQKTVGAARVLV